MDTATTASQINLMEMAKQGDMNALAALMNRSLKVHGIFAELSLTKGCLVVSAMFDQTAPNKTSLVEMLKRGVGNVRPKGVQRVMVQAMSIHDRSVAWQSAFILPKAETATSSSLASIAARVGSLARGGEEREAPAAVRAEAVSQASSIANSGPATKAQPNVSAQLTARAEQAEPALASPKTLQRQAIAGYVIMAIGLIMMLTGLGQSIQAAPQNEATSDSYSTEALFNKAIHAQAGGAMMIAGAVLAGAASKSR